MADMFAALCGWDNLWCAYRAAARGKRGRASAAHFDYQLADQLIALQAELVDGRYRPGATATFASTNPNNA